MNEEIAIAYGRTGLTVSVPAEYRPVVLRGASAPPLDDPRGAIVRALREPMGCEPLARLAAEAVRRTQEKDGGEPRVGIVFNDITRATPNELIVGGVIEELLRAGVSERCITLFNATGTHRTQTREELEEILGAELVQRFRIVQNECEAPGAHTHVGTTSGGNEVRILTEFLRQDIRIATGFIEPHFFAGYSGGGKAVVPGLAHLSTILHNHGPAHMDDPDATWGRTKGNPLWDDLSQAAGFADPIFLVNVTMDGEKRVTGVFAGDRLAAHEAGCLAVEKHAVVAVDGEFDIVVTSNSGYPLDLNLYQAVKGMSAAARIVRPGGEIIIAAECSDGVPSHGLFGRLVAEAESPDALVARLRTPEYQVRDAWQAHVFALVARKARITLVSNGIRPSEVPQALCRQAASVEDALQTALQTATAIRSEDAPSLCILPDGPLTIPVVRAAEQGAVRPCGRGTPPSAG